MCDAIGRQTVERAVLRAFTIAEIRAALATDPYMNNLPLSQWDELDPIIRSAVGGRAPDVMKISWSARSPLKAGTWCWSLSETVCVCKAAARRLAEESAS